MSDLKTQLSTLHDQLSVLNQVDDETRQQLLVVLSDISRLLHPEAQQHLSPVEAVDSIAARFDVDHPALSGAIRQLVDALAKAGI